MKTQLDEVKAYVVVTAQSEITDRAWGTTQQVLAVHEVELLGDKPEVVGVVPSWNKEDWPHWEDAPFYVFFRLRGARYFFVVSVTPRAPHRVVGTFVEPRVRAWLSITSETMTPEGISARLGLVPSDCMEKGERRRAGPAAKMNHWRFAGSNDAGFAEAIVSDLLDMVEPVRERVAGLLPACQVLVSVAYDGYADWMGGLHLKPSLVRRIAALGAGFDLDLYASGPTLP